MGSPWPRKVTVVSPDGDSHGANIHSGLREHRDLCGCGSAPADTHSLEPAPPCSCSKPVSCSFRGMSSRKASAPQAAIFPQEGTLQEECICQLWLQPRPPAPLDMPWERHLTSPYAASWLQLPSIAVPLPLTHSSNTWPGSSHSITNSAHITSALPVPCHIPRVLPAA